MVGTLFLWQGTLLLHALPQAVCLCCQHCRQEQSGCIILQYLVTKHYFSSLVQHILDIRPCTQVLW